MAGKARIGEVYVQVVPTFNDLQAQVEDELEKGGGVKFKADVDTAGLGESGTRAGAGFGKNFATAIGAAAIVKGIVDTFQQLYQIGDTFDSMGDSIQITTGATGDSLERIKNVSKDIFTTIPVSADEAAVAVGELSKRLELSDSQLTTIASQVLEAGRLLGTPVDTAALAQSLRIMGVDASEYSDVLDTVFAVSQKTGVGMNELFTGVQSNSAVLKTLGLGYEESANLIGLMDAAGLDADTTLSQLGKGIVKFAKAGEPAGKAIEGVITQITSLVAAGDQAGAIALSSEVFGTKSALNFVNAIESGAINAESFSSELQATDQTILGLADDTNDFAEEWQIAQNKMTVAIEPLASAVFNFAGVLLEDLGPTITQIAEGIAAFSAYANENQWVLVALAAVVGGVLLVAIGAMTLALYGMAAAGFAALAPLLPILLGIAAVVAAFIAGYLIGTAIFHLIADNWSSIVTFMTEAGANFGSFIGDVFVGLAEFIFGILKGIGNFWIDMINFIISGINYMIAGLNSVSFQTPEWLGGGKVGFNIGYIPNVPRLANGGTIKPDGGGTLAMLAEAGRSEVVMDEGKWNNLIDQILSGNVGASAGGDTIFQIYQQPGESAEDLVRKIGEYMELTSLNGGN